MTVRSSSNPPLGRPMDVTVKANVVDGLFFCTTLTNCRRGHISFV